MWRRLRIWWRYGLRLRFDALDQLGPVSAKHPARVIYFNRSTHTEDE